MDFKKMVLVMCIINRRWAGARKKLQTIFQSRESKMTIFVLTLTVFLFVLVRNQFFLSEQFKIGPPQNPQSQTHHLNPTPNPPNPNPTPNPKDCI